MEGPCAGIRGIKGYCDRPLRRNVYGVPHGAGEPGTVDRHNLKMVTIAGIKLIGVY